jgi:signal transduction histidine kinase
MGGNEEKIRARNHPETKIGIGELVLLASELHKAEQSRLDSIVDNIKSYPSALHEIRKYNRTIKQEAERLCHEQSPGDPDKADSRLVSIFKCSELMTLQFEVLELIANQSLVDLPINYPSEIYKIFDKCVRIYQVTAANKPVTLKIEGDSPRALVNDKTFHIIGTVLLENAIKYSVPKSQILIRIELLSKDRCKIAINNITQHVEALPRFFERGARGKHDGTGMGYGLFLAQSVARQHGTEIQFQRLRYADDLDNYIFSFELNTLAVPGQK